MIITFTNQKGGVGKTTSAANVGACLASKKKNVLYIDLDGQANLTYCVGLPPAEQTAFDAMRGKLSAGEGLSGLIQKTPYGDAVASGPSMMTAEAMGRGVPPDALRNLLKEMRLLYDYIIIDTPPSLGLMSVNALTAADAVVIPATADLFSFQGISQLAETIDAVHANTNPGLFVAGILLTQYDARTSITKAYTDYIAEQAAGMGSAVFGTKIRKCTALRESQTAQKSVIDYSPRSNATKDYTAFTKELLAELKGR